MPGAALRNGSLASTRERGLKERKTHCIATTCVKSDGEEVKKKRLFPCHDLRMFHQEKWVFSPFSVAKPV